MFSYALDTNMGTLPKLELAMSLIPLVSLVLGIAQVCVQSTVQQVTSDTILRQWPPAPIFGGDNLASVPAHLQRSVTDSLLAAGAVAIVASVLALLQAINSLYPVCAKPHEQCQ